MGGFSTIGFSTIGGGNMDLVDRPDRELGFVKSIFHPYPIPYDNFLCSDSNCPIAIRAKVDNYQITNIRPDPGTLSAKYGYETQNTIYYVNAIRFSHNVDEHDLTTFITQSTTPIEVLSINLAEEINAKEFLAIMSLNNTSYARTYGEIKTYDANNQETGTISNYAYGGEKIISGRLLDIQVKTIKFFIWVDSGKGLTSLRKIIITY